jgi:hypothetical protein
MSRGVAERFVHECEVALEKGPTEQAAELWARVKTAHTFRLRMSQEARKLLKEITDNAEDYSELGEESLVQSALADYWLLRNVFENMGLDLEGEEDE